MKHALNGLLTLTLAAVVTAMSALSALAEGPILVSSGKDTGEGSLSAALKTAGK